MSGLLDVGADDVYDIEVSRSQPSFQLVGRPDHGSIDLAAASKEGRPRGRPAAGHRQPAGVVRRRSRRDHSGVGRKAGDAAEAARRLLARRRSRRARRRPRTVRTGLAGVHRSAAHARSPRGADHLGDLGDGIPARILMAPRAGARPARRNRPSRRASRRRPGSMSWACSFSGGATRISSTASEKTRVTWPRRSARTSARRNVRLLEARRMRDLSSEDAMFPGTVDVVVVGARCAGAATAMLLARAGRSVLLVDRGDYGSDILSTHALDARRRAAAGALEPARPHHRGRHAAGEGDDVPPRRQRRCACRSRRSTASTRSMRRDAPCWIAFSWTRPNSPAPSSVSAHASRRSLAEATAASTESSFRIVPAAPFQVTANYVVGADGMRSTVAGLVGAPVYRSGRHATAVLYGYWPDLPVDGYNWHYGTTGAAGVIPTNDGETLVFAGVPAARWADMIAAGRFAGIPARSAGDRASARAVGPRPSANGR